MADTDTKDNRTTQVPPAAAPASSGGGSSTTRTQLTNGSGTVVALMGFAVLFSLVGHEIDTITKAPAAEGDAGVAGTVLSSGGKILVGGTIATALLVLLTHAGNGGRQFAVGLALITCASSVLVSGGPVWDVISRNVGTTAVTPTGNTAPTGGTGKTSNTSATA